MATFFIDTTSGQVATGRQLVEAGIAPPDDVPPRPWHRVQGSGDASTMWYAVLRKNVRGVFIGTLALRHTSNHASLLQQGWQEVPVEQIGVPCRPPGGNPDDNGALQAPVNGRLRRPPQAM